jgi:alcohol dehydrogenase YqhD (iron-dependent ADH family)
MMENFRLCVPTDIRFGKNRLDELPEALASYGKRVLLAYGGGSIKR